MKSKTSESLCIIGRDATFNGTLSSGGSIDIEGIFTGDLYVETANIRKEASVTGQITATSIRVQGKIENSNIKCSKIIVESTAIILNTTIEYSSLMVEHGAILTATLNHIVPK